MDFKYNIDDDDAKDCINDTEIRLRSLIVNVMTSKYGEDWHKSKNGLSEDKIIALKLRIDEEQKKFPHQKVSNRIIDFCDIVDLKNLIVNNWSEFKLIFKFKSEIETYFNILNKIRISEMHSRKDLLKHQYHLCLGVCGELLLAIENWSKGFTHKIEKYRCTYKFVSKIENEKEEEAGIKSVEDAKKWLDEVIKKLEGRLEEKYFEQGSQYLLRAEKNHLKIIISKISKYNYEGYYMGVNLDVITDNYSALENFVDVSGLPYRVFENQIVGDLNVDYIMKEIENKTGKTPSSSVAQGIAEGEKIFTNVDYRIGKNIRVSLNRKGMQLICDSGLNMGFLHAHKIFSIEKILNILYGEYTPIDVNKFIKDSI